MLALPSFSFRFKLRATIVVISLALLGVAAAGRFGLQHTSRSAAELGGVFLPSVEHLLVTDRELFRAMSAERGMMLTDPGSSEYQMLLTERSGYVDKARQEIKKFAATMPLNAAMSKHLATFQTKLENWDTDAQSMLKGLIQDNSADARANALQMSLVDLSAMFEQARSQIAQLIKYTRSEASAAVVSATESSRRASLVLFIAVGLGIAVCVVLAIWVPMMVSRPLRSITERMHEFADGAGDLTRRIEVKSQDEFGQLAHQFNEFVNKLHGIIKQVTETAEHMSSSAHRLLGVAGEGAESMQAQQSETDQVAAAVNELSATAAEVARSASDTAEAVRESDAQVTKGRAEVDSTIAQVNQLAHDVEHAAEAIARLDSDSQAISTVIAVIHDIAEQTNLLALNAAIEAARAGDQGRGFAVVASEVRTLANRTQRSTEEIRKTVERLQKSAASASESMSAGRDRAHATVDVAGATGKSLAALVTAMTRINDMTTQIAQAAEEQNAVTADVNESVTRISQVATATATGAQATTEGCEALARSAGGLQQLVGSFRV